MNYKQFLWIVFGASYLVLWFQIYAINTDEQFDLTKLSEGVGLQLCNGHYVRSDFIYDKDGNFGFSVENKTIIQVNEYVSRMKTPIKTFTYSCIGENINYYRSKK